MATLSADQYTQLRQAAAQGQATVPWNKAQLNAAAQAVEDWFEANRASLNTAINAATTPLVLPAAVKRALLISYLTQKAGRE